MTKTDLIYAVAFRRRNRQPTKEELAEASLAVSHLLEQITDEIAKGGRMEVRHFGVFQKSIWNNRFRRNPLTGKTWRAGEQANMRFRASKKLNGRLQKPKDKP